MCPHKTMWHFYFQGELESLNSASHDINVLETELEVSELCTSYVIVNNGKGENECYMPKSCSTCS